MAGGLAAGTLGLPGTAQAAASLPRGKVTQNGWPTVGKDAVDRMSVEGSASRLALLPGPTAVVLLHVARRFNYEIAELEKGDIQGWRNHPSIKAPFETNYRSGTAIEIQANLYPTGSAGNLFAPQIALIRDILMECEGVVRWAGDDQIPKEGHFQIDVLPGSDVLAKVAAKLRGWEEAPGAGPGAPVDPFSRDRRTASLNLERLQRSGRWRP
ncbi:hypothetical protein [Actinomadura meridiana]|uniref:hypothetical protein n=1 Tax=Actinomadura meridiana TaxID=559626 RepID=UPI0031F0A707